MKVVLLLIFALIFLGISAKGKVCDFEEYNVVCTIYDGGRNHTHKAPRREKEIQLKVTAQSVCIESGVEKSQFSMLSFFSNTGELICTNLLAELKKRLKISIFLWRKSCASR